MSINDDIKSAAVSSGYYGSLNASEQASFDANPTTWVTTHPFIQSSYPTIWNAYLGFGSVVSSVSGGTPISGVNLVDPSTTTNQNVSGISNPPSSGSFESLFPKQTSQLIDLGNSISDVWNTLTPLQQYAYNLSSQVNTINTRVSGQLTDLGTGESNLQTSLNTLHDQLQSEIDAMNARLSSQVTSLGQSVSSASSGSNPFNFLSPLKPYAIYIILAFIAVIAFSFLRK